MTSPQRRHGAKSPAAQRSDPRDFAERRDLYFFARPGKRVHHVGFVAAPPDADGTRHMLHACGTSGEVRHEAVTGDRLTTLIAVHRLPTT